MGLVMLVMGLLGMWAAWWAMPRLRRRAVALSVDLGGNLAPWPDWPVVAAGLGLALGLWCGLVFTPGSRAVAVLCLSLSLVTLAWIDLETGLLPDFMTLPLLCTGWVLNAFGMFVAWPQAVAGAFVGYGFLLAVDVLFHRWTGQHGLGGGDMKCVAALGAWLGWQPLPSLLLLAAALSVAGWCAAALLRRRFRHRYQAFGPGLAVSGLAVLFVTVGSAAPWAIQFH